MCEHPTSTGRGDDRTAVVVGAGIGGLTAAIALRRIGWRVTVLERAESHAAAQVGSGLTIWSNAVRVLDELGLGSELRAIGSRLERFDNRLATGRRLASWPVGEWGRELGWPNLNVSRRELHELLAAQLDDGDIRWGSSCASIGEGGPSAVVTLGNGDELRAAAVIGADGLNSTVRRLLLGDGPPRYAGYAVWRAIVESVPIELEPATFVQLWGRGTRFGWYRLAGDRLYWFAVANVSETRNGSTPVFSRADEVRQRFATWPDPVGRLLDATPGAAISRVNTYDRDPVRTWGRGRVTLLGDAAHPMTFNVGQGACQAIEDGVELASALAVDAEDVPAALRRFEAGRLERTATITRRARRIGSIAGWSNPIACAARNRLLGVILPGPAARQAREVNSQRATVPPAFSTPDHSLEELFRVNAH